MCGRALNAFVAARSAQTDRAAAARTTARPPSRPAALEMLAASVHEAIEKRTRGAGGEVVCSLARDSLRHFHDQEHELLGLGRRP